KDFIRETAPVFRKPTIEQLGEFIAPTFRALIDGSKYVDDRLREIIDEVQPDVIVEDNVVSFPALPASGRPWVRITSCNPAEILDPDVPPVFSGYPADDKTGWDEFREEFRRTHVEMHADFDAFCRDRGAPPLPPLEFMHTSPHLNLYLYPDEVDYPRGRPLDDTWHNLQSSVRATDAPYEPPVGPEPLIYLSLGSLASGDVDLMRTLIGTLADAPYRFVVSKGPQHDQLELAPNMTGAEFLPQVSILPHVDLVITHGGNNTVTESLRFGRPMILLPVFWDQYDNAQRMHETGFGIRLDTYAHEPAELTGAIERLLADGPLHERLNALSSRLAAAPGTVKAADLIERAARDHQ
ncbi:MAG TPA: nucleotide disphospho-sugar-binding domain-containing protein, partial [Solirubrobacteraceae bacterium]|nr:nucleotide disphospho-sugar-binding domain-containing protein [Solirubrobacteraceae bacterium]